MAMMMMPTLGPEIFARGFRFDPSPLEVVTYYLPRLLAGAPLHDSVRRVVHHADVYADEPGDLARRFFPLPRTGHRFFFTYCRLQKPHRAGKASGRATRAAGPGSWHSQGFADIVDRDKVKVGEIRKLRYKKGGKYTDWLMDEYSMCCGEDAVAAAGGDRQFVFCNIYVSPRAAPDSAAHQESAAFFSAHPAPVVIAPAAAPPKRPAPEIAEPPCPKRMRGAVGPTPPVVPPGGYCTTTSFAQPQPCVPNHGVPPPPVMWSPPAPAPTPLAASPRPFVQPMQQMPMPTPSMVRACRVPVQACMPQGGVASSSTPLVMMTRSPSPAPAQTRPAVQPSRSPAPIPTPPRSPPKQQMPPPPVLVRASHIPVQATAPHCRPAQPCVQRKLRTRDPFEAAELGDEDDEEEQRVAAATEAKESPATLQDDEDLAKFIEDAMATTEDTAANSDGSMMTDEEMDQHLASLFDDETLVVPKEEIP